MHKILPIASLLISILVFFPGCKEKDPEPSNLVKDYDGNAYHVLEIGDQSWMLENLKVTHYRNGEAIPLVTENTDWETLNSGARCNFRNEEAYADTAGRLYNWYAVNDSRQIAPKGWHVPSDAEWQTLVDFLGGIGIAGGKMKETGQNHWVFNNTGATNESGFTAISSGYRYYMGIYADKASCDCANWWSSTEVFPNGALIWEVYSGSTGVIRWSGLKESGFSVRCIRD
ncbi:MAG: fibrobacter succinogenes major paralogous domain-containing protein [Bacteroidales bacterium]